MKKNPEGGRAKPTSIALKPSVRALADNLCDRECRSLANLIEVAIVEYARNRGIEFNYLTGEATFAEPERKAA